MESTDLDVLMAMSEFSIVLTKANYKIIRLRNRVDNYRDKYLQQINNEKLETIQNSLNRNNNNIPEIGLDKQTNLWLIQLMDYLKEMEFFGRTLSLKLFRDYYDYLYIFRSPIRREDREFKVPICNITFPEDQLNNFTHTMPKKRNKRFVETNRCKRTQIPNVCG